MYSTLDRDNLIHLVTNWVWSCQKENLHDDFILAAIVCGFINHLILLSHGGCVCCLSMFVEVSALGFSDLPLSIIEVLVCSWLLRPTWPARHHFLCFSIDELISHCLPRKTIQASSFICRFSCLSRRVGFSVYSSIPTHSPSFLEIILFNGDNCMFLMKFCFHQFQLL